jgi:hypothetical protein
VVFHKAACVTLDGQPRILTISSREALLKLWTMQDGGWRSEALWHPRFGGERDRLRDFEIADVNGDGRAEIVVATHDQGVVAVVSRGADGWQSQELCRRPNTFVHEVEVGDLDGDGALEIYATPSQPNETAKSQPGQLVVFRFDRRRGGYQAETIAELAHTHIKEILVTDLDANGSDELYAVHEASRAEGGGETHPLEVVQYHRLGSDRWGSRLLASLPGAVQARVLLDTDIIRSGRRHLLVTTLKGGIWILTPAKASTGEWRKGRFDADSSGVEHAAATADLDADGFEELYVSAENRRVVHQFAWTGQGLVAQTIYDLPGRDLTWSITPCVPQPL